MKIKKLLYATLFSTLLMPAMLHALYIIPEFEAAKGKTQEEINQIFKNRPKMRKCFEVYLGMQNEMKKIEQKMQKDINNLALEKGELLTEKYKLNAKIDQLSQELENLKKIDIKQQAQKDIDNLILEKGKLCTKIDQLAQMLENLKNTEPFIRLEEQFTQQIKTFSNISSTFQKSFFKNYDLYSPINLNGERASHKDIWIELLKENSALFFETLQKEQKLKNLEQEMFNIYIDLTKKLNATQDLDFELQDLNISDNNRIIEINDKLFKSLGIRDQLNTYSKIHETIKNKKEELNIDSILLKTLNGKWIPGTTDEGKNLLCKFDADFFKSLPYFNPNYQRIRSGDTLLEYIINPLVKSKISTTNNIIKDAYSHIFQSLFPKLDTLGLEDLSTNQCLDKTLEEFVKTETTKLQSPKLDPQEKDQIKVDLNKILNTQLISKILLYNFQFASIIACKVWNQYTPDVLATKTFVEEEIEKIIKSIKEESQLYRENNPFIDLFIQKLQFKLSSNDVCSISELIQKKALKLKKDVIAMLDQEIKKLSEKMETLRIKGEEEDPLEVGAFFKYVHSEDHALQEKFAFEWLLDQVVDQKVIPENLTIFPDPIV